MQAELEQPSKISIPRLTLKDIQRQVEELQKKLEDILKPVTENVDAMHQSTTADAVSMKAAAQSIMGCVELALSPPATTNFTEIENQYILLDDVHKALSSLDATSA